MRVIQAKDLVEEFDLEFFKSGSTFGALSDDGLRYLLNEGRVLALDKGDCLFDWGERGDCFYVVLKGAIAFYIHHLNHDRCISNHEFGEELGFVAMVALHQRIGRGVATEASLVLEVSSALFYRFHQEYPTDFGILLLNLSREMARRIRTLSNMLVQHDIDH